jgi:hypothetical protein
MVDGVVGMLMVWVLIMAYLLTCKTANWRQEKAVPYGNSYLWMTFSSQV